ncbi:MAG: hypothetical protein RQ751_12655, partial [Longimicrobiales bacterium]|nr:hypothetical protein [Longimicrobiales bacterium]
PGPRDVRWAEALADVAPVVFLREGEAGDASRGGEAGGMRWRLTVRERTDGSLEWSTEPLDG